MKRSFLTRVVEWFNTLILLGFAFCATYPLYNIYLYAFNDGQDSFKAPLLFIPRVFSLSSMSIAFATDGIMDAFKISILRTVIGTVLSVFLTASLAYALSKKKLPGHKYFSTFFFITFIFNGGFIAFFLTIRLIGLYNNFLVYILPGLYNYWFMIIFRSFFLNIPASIEESAEIDGSSHFIVFLRLILPLSKPVIAAVALFTAVNHWNDWFSGTFYVKSRSLIPLQTLLQKMISEMDMIKNIANVGGQALEATASVTPTSVRMAVVVMTVTPIILIYPFLQRYFIKGIMIGAIKG